MHFNCFVLLDINECAVENGGCGQICNNLPGTYECKCEDGYLLDTNSHSCSGIVYYNYNNDYINIIYDS